MAQIHILEGRKLDGPVASYRVVFHVPVPPQDKVAGVVLTPSSVLGNIDAQEAAALAIGDLIEVVEEHRYNDNEPLANQGARLKARWTELAASRVASYKKEYRFYGQELSVP